MSGPRIFLHNRISKNRRSLSPRGERQTGIYGGHHDHLRTLRAVIFEKMGGFQTCHTLKLNGGSGALCTPNKITADVRPAIKAVEWRRYVPSAILIGIPRSRAPSQCKGQR